MAESSKNEISKKAPEEVLKEINDSLTRIRRKYHDQARVYRVPQELRKVNESAYTPSLVSIGPLHSEDPYLQSQMRDVKLYYMHSLFHKVYVRPDAQAAAIKKCLDEMDKSILPEVENFYGEEEVSANLLLIDGCFILELLRRHTEILAVAQEESKEDRRPCHPSSDSSSSLQTGLLSRNEESRQSGNTGKSHKTNPGNPPGPDPIFGFPPTSVAVQHDLLLLENQLPLLVLKKLFPHTIGSLQGHLHLSAYILNYFHGILNIGHDCPQKIPVLSPACDQHEVDLEECHHILHFLHHHYHMPKPDKVGGQLDNKCMPFGGQLDNKCMPFASHLDSYGVKFEGKEDKFEVQFEPRWCTCRRACFSIPTLHIDDCTERVLRNFIAFEMCFLSVSGYFTSYAYLLDELINTEDDVRVLEEAEVIRNRLGTCKEASDLFNNLCKNVAVGEFHFAKIHDEVVRYNKWCWLAVVPMTIQHLKRKCSASPWAFVAFMVAFLAFAMQAIEFITSYTG